MKQIDFIMISNNIKGVTVNQGPAGTVIAKVIDGCTITHNYKKKNKITIEFETDKYLIDKKSDLKQIYDIYLENINNLDSLSKLKDYCSKNLVKIE